MRWQIAFGIALLSCGIGCTRAGPGDLPKTAPEKVTRDGATLEVIEPRQVIRFTTSQPGLATGARAELLGKSLADYFKSHTPAPRYALTFGRFDELNNRMAAAASCSDQWDTQQGRTKGDVRVAAWLRETLDRDHAYRELTPAVDSAGFRLTIRSLESIALCSPAEIDWKQAARACDTPLPPTAKLPCGALTTFDLQKK